MPAKAGITLLLMLLKNGGVQPAIFFAKKDMTNA